MFSLTPFRITVLTGTGLPSVYVQPSSFGARIDTEILVSKHERKLAERPRCVNDPVAARAKAIEVRFHTSLIFLRSFMRKIYPKIS